MDSLNDYQVSVNNANGRCRSPSSCYCQDEVAISKIGIIGMSQGGTIAHLVANQMQEIDFLVNVVGGAVPMYETLVFEENHN